MSPKSSSKKFDLNPQWLNLNSVTETAPVTYTSKATSTPVVLGLSDGKSYVMEILKVFFSGSPPDLINIQTTYTSYFLNKSATTATPSDSLVIARCNRCAQVYDTAATDATVAAAFPINPIVLDLTDGAGNGMLYAGKELHLAVVSVQCTNAKTAECRVLYRLKAIDANELVGMISE